MQRRGRHVAMLRDPRCVRVLREVPVYNARVGEGGKMVCRGLGCVGCAQKVLNLPSCTRKSQCHPGGEQTGNCCITSQNAKLMRGRPQEFSFSIIIMSGEILGEYV